MPTKRSSSLPKLQSLYDTDYGKFLLQFKGLRPFVEGVRNQHFNETGHIIGKSDDDILGKEHHGEFLVDTLEISCEECGSEASSPKTDYPIHILLNPRSNGWEVCVGQSNCNCASYNGKGVRRGVELPTLDEVNRTKPAVLRKRVNGKMIEVCRKHHAPLKQVTETLAHSQQWTCEEGCVIVRVV